MKNLKKIISITCLMIICLLFIPAGEIKSQVLQMSAEELTNESTAVFYGKCIGKRSEWNENRSIIYTYVTIAPEEYIKGNLGSQAVIAVPGGRVDDIIYEVSEMPVFTEGEEVVAFIWTNPSGKNLVTGGFQGKLKVETDKNSGKRMVLGAGNMDKKEPHSQAPGQIKKAENMQLEDFVGKLKGYMMNN
jgi:hypothetical protein